MTIRRSGADRAVRDVGHVLVQHRHRRHQLAQQAERGVDVERHVGGFGEAQHLGQPHAGGDVGHQRQRRRRILQPFDAAHAAVAGVAEGGEMAQALAQRELEGRHCRELAAQAEHFDRLVARAIDGETARPETVFERDRCRRRRGRECWIHADARCVNCAVRIPRLSGRFCCDHGNALTVSRGRRPEFGQIGTDGVGWNCNELRWRAAARIAARTPTSLAMSL